MLPPTNVVKTNSDAAFNADNLCGSSGFVIRNGRGEFLVGGSIWYSSMANALTAEALARRDGVFL